jgi:hypothetical protein
LKAPTIKPAQNENRKIGRTKLNDISILFYHAMNSVRGYQSEEVKAYFLIKTKMKSITGKTAKNNHHDTTDCDKHTSHAINDSEHVLRDFQLWTFRHDLLYCCW